MASHYTAENTNSVTNLGFILDALTITDVDAWYIHTSHRWFAMQAFVYRNQGKVRFSLQCYKCIGSNSDLTHA